MESTQIIQKLKLLASDVSLLYVEDNEKLRAQAQTFLGKFFNRLFIAADGVEGMELFKAHQPDIVITDLKMPNMDGMKMIEAIRALSKETVIIISSAYDDKPLLFEAIHKGVFRYLKKPLDIYSISQALLEAIESKQKNSFDAAFAGQIRQFVDYEHNLFLVLKDKKPVAANARFLEFYGVETIEDFNKKFPFFLDIFLTQKEFFSSEVTSDLKMLFEGVLALKNAKLIDAKNHLHHMILSSHTIEGKPDEVLLSFHDITDLGLIPLFDLPHSELVARQTDQSVMHFLQKIVDNGGDLKLFNLYKGLPISSPATVSHLGDTTIGFKTSTKQIHAITLEKRTLLSSELLPMDLLFETIESLPVSGDEVVFAHGTFAATSSTQRKVVRLVPDPNTTQLTLLVNDRAVGMEHKVLDLSVLGLRMQGKLIPDALQSGDILKVDIVLYLKKMPIIINSDVTIYKIIEHTHEKEKYKELILLFSQNSKVEKNLTPYLAQRQMEIIREFKGQNYEH